MKHYIDPPRKQVSKSFISFLILYSVIAFFGSIHVLLLLFLAPAGIKMVPIYQRMGERWLDCGYRKGMLVVTHVFLLVICWIVWYFLVGLLRDMLW